MGAKSRGSARTAIASKPNEFDPILQEIAKEYPAIGKHNFTAFREAGPGYGEFYPAWESHNPMPGHHAIGLRKEEGLGSLKNFLAGESLHLLGTVDQ